MWLPLIVCYVCCFVYPTSSLPYNFPHFTDEETDEQRLHDLPKVKELPSSKAEMGRHVFLMPKPKAFDEHAAEKAQTGRPIIREFEAVLIQIPQPQA